MTDSQRNRKRRAQGGAQAKVQSEMLTVAQAQRFLCVSPVKMTQLLKRGLLKAHENPIDLREKLIKRSDLEDFIKKHRHD